MKRKTATTSKGNGRALTAVILACVAAFALAAWGIAAICGKLAETYERQCCVTDSGEQIEIIGGKVIEPRLIVNHFGLTNGVNLAHVDFPKLRDRLLECAPNIRDIRITRRLPNFVRIEVIERIPVARVIGHGANASKNNVADREGVIFWYPRKHTALLPIIRETKKNAVANGKSLSGMALAALHLLQEASAPEYDVLKIQEVETFKPDYVLATLGDSSRAKIAWEDMDKPSRASRISLTNQLARLTSVVKCNVAAGTKLWNATDWHTPSRIYADDPTKVE